MTQILLDAAPRPEQETHLRRVQSSAESLMVVLNDILDLSKIEARKLTLEQLGFGLRAEIDTVMETFRSVAGAKGVRLDVELAPEVPNALVGDPARLRQILVNLVGNAVKFTEKGEIEVRVGVASQTTYEICLHFAVRDTGIGIPRDRQQVVFEAFAQGDGSTTRKYGGTGLGLSISARLVELMGGDIWVESEVGRGSTFRFTALFGLPAIDAGLLPRLGPPAAIGPPAPLPAPAPLKVLVAEDEEVHREMVARLLEQRGHAAVVVANGREALAQLTREPFDVLVLDLQMPELDGLQTAALVRSRERGTSRRLPIVGMTASGASGDRDRCREAGMDRLVSKPLLNEELFAAIEGAGEPAPARRPADARTTFLSGLGDDEALAQKLIEIFVANSPGLLAKLREAIDGGDVAALSRAAHALKGAVANFPVASANEAAERMEELGLTGDLRGARDAYPALADEIARLRETLPALIARS
jgi:CheY-like chemotaxis protein